MIEKNIDHLAHKLKQNKNKGNPGAIAFIGAGCSVSAGIPIASIIVDEVLELHKDHPDIKCLSTKPNYVDLMKCLGPRERRDIFMGYVENSKINVSHIYLAHFLKLGYIDYIVTVNFDNLAQQALSLYNIFPPTYDISILNSIDLATTSLDIQSIIYLHGQYNGLWQLNTSDEMNKVIQNRVAFNIFNKITTNRLWMIVGYSGQDFIFDQLVELQRFYDHLYWVGYKDNEPQKNVKEKLLDKANSECFYIKGFDSDSFFLKLNSELKETDPVIFSKPFSYLSQVQDKIVDIDDSELYKSVKERLIESKNMVKDAINKYENIDSTEPQMTNDEIERNQLKTKIIESLLADKYEEAEYFEKIIREKNFPELLSFIADFYFNWGSDLGKLATTKSGEEAETLYMGAFQKFAKAVEIKPDMHEAWYNWGNYLGDLAMTKSGEEADTVYKEVFRKYARVVEIRPDEHEAWNNWGTDLGNLAMTKSGEEADTLYKEAFQKYARAVDIKPEYQEAWYNWGNNIGNLAMTKSGEQADTLYKEAFQKYSRAVEIKPDDYEAWNNWGNYLGDLVKTKSGEEADTLFKEVFQKYARAVEIKLDYHEAWNNWGISLGNLAKTKSGEEADTLYKVAFQKFARAVEIKPDMDEAWNNWGIYLGNLAKTKSGEEADTLYKEVFRKYARAVEIKPDLHEAWYMWGTNLVEQVQTKTVEEKEIIFKEAEEKFIQSFDLGGKSYNLACLYSIWDKAEDAFRILESCLNKRETDFDFVEKDNDWDELRNTPEYIKLKEKYSGNNFF